MFKPFQISYAYPKIIGYEKAFINIAVVRKEDIMMAMEENAYLV